MDVVQHDEARVATPSDHSTVVGGSSATRMIACPGHYQLLQGIPGHLLAKEETSYAAQGTMLHEVMAKVLNEGVADPMELVGQTFYDRVLTARDVTEAIAPALAAFDVYCASSPIEGDEFDFYVEQRVELKGIPGAFGTTDIAGRWTERKRAAVIDWKFGAGVPVYIIDDDGKPNAQLMFYAAATALSMPHVIDWQDITFEVDLIIVQPYIDLDDAEGSAYSRGIVRMMTVNVAQLSEFRGVLIRAVSEALNAEQPTLSPGKHCTFCKAKPVCPHHLSPVLDLSAIVQDNGATISPDLAGSDAVPAELNDADYAALLGTILDLGDALEPYVREAAAQAQFWMESGGTVPGRKLVAKRPGHDKWKDEDKADAYLGRQGLDVKERRVVKTITPAVARKALKALGKTLDEDRYVEPGVSSGFTLAPEDDARPSALTTTQSVAALGAKLTALTGGQ